MLAVLILQIEPMGTGNQHSHEEPADHTEEHGHSEAGEAEVESVQKTEDRMAVVYFSKDDLNLEVTIYERNVPSQFRIYATDTQGNNIPLDQVKLNVDLHRLERVDRISFRPSGDYLLGDKVVVEPHSFDVKIKAEWRKQNYRWQYSQVEARAEISEEEAKNAGIETTRAGSAKIHQVVQLSGEIGLHEKHVAHVVPRLDAMVTSVHKDLGDPVKKGDILAILDSRELADVKSEYLTTVKRAEPVRVELERQQLINKNYPDHARPSAAGIGSGTRFTKRSTHWCWANRVRKSFLLMGG